MNNNDSRTRRAALVMEAGDESYVQEWMDIAGAPSSHSEDYYYESLLHKLLRVIGSSPDSWSRI